LNVLVGTSGYSYKEWKGRFYPAGLKEAGMLRFYAERFPTVEINNTFYRMPSPELLARWEGEVPDGFRFILKAPRRITHEKRLHDVADTVARLLEVSAGLGGKRGPFLFQLPPYFKKDAARLRDFLQLLPRGVRAAFEFRDPSWEDEETAETLRAAGAVLCLADTDEGRGRPAARGHRRLGLPPPPPRGLRPGRVAGVGRPHPLPAVGRGLRLLQARGRGARAGAGGALVEALQA
jgi:uncharacterized protein YecE (DUF72 family)